jgi:NADH:ubiquinone oxidoreductase subunit 5 (subunit L)/multisubunit Na+/H+ antiporter MnhA subunit
MQHLFILSELGVRLIPLCALLASLMIVGEQLKLKTLLISQIVTVACAAVGMTLFLLTQQINNPDPVTIFNELVRLDFLAIVMAASISLITLIVVWFSERNLLGDKTRLLFIQHLMALSTVASILVAANDIILFLVCWHAISILLWRTIGLKKDAVRSSRIVLYHHLFSDVCFFLAVNVIASACHSTGITPILHNLNALQDDFIIKGCSLPLAKSTVVALLLLVAMVCKSALFPFHKWLLATIEAPTPLSGLLHAGIVNVSAIMAARLYPVLIQSTSVHVLWLVWSVGAAFIGTLCMSTRSDTKGELVFSTVGQMGFMSLECAVGAIPAAIFHLIAHGFFKCLLFLQAHSSISEGLLKMRFGHAYGGVDRSRSKLHLFCVCLLAVPVLIWLCLQESVDSAASLSVLIAMGALIMSVEAFKRIGLGLLLAASATFLAAVVLAGDLSKFAAYYMEPTPLHGDWILVVSIIAFGVITYWLSQVRGATRGKALYVHALNGLYMDELSDAFKCGTRRVARILSRKGSSHGRRKAGAKAGC